MESQNFKRLSPQSMTSAKRDSPIAMRHKAKPSYSFENACDRHSASALKNSKHTEISNFGQRTRPMSRGPSPSFKA